MISLRGGILMFTGNFAEVLSQQILVGINLSREIGRTRDERSLRKAEEAGHIYIYIYI